MPQVWPVRPIRQAEIPPGHPRRDEFSRRFRPEAVTHSSVTVTVMCSNWALRSGWLRPSFCLLLPLQAVAHLVQQLAHQSVAHLVSHRGQTLGQLPNALRGTPQRTLRLPRRRRLHPRLEIDRQSPILIDLPLATASSPSHSARVELLALLEFADPSRDCGTRNDRRPLHQRDATVPQRHRFRGSPTTATTLGQRRLHRLELAPDRRDLHRNIGRLRAEDPPLILCRSLSRCPMVVKPHRREPRDVSSPTAPSLTRAPRARRRT